jgi:hypothetical protein
MLRCSLFPVLLMAALAVPALADDAYTSTSGKYSISFPGKVKETVQEVLLPDGAKTKVFSAMHEASATKVFVTTYSDYDEASAKSMPPKKLLENARDGGAKGGNLVEDKEITFGADKIPGREYLIAKGPFFMRFRAYLRGNRLYQVGVVAGTKEEVMAPDANAYFESFKLLK